MYTNLEFIEHQIAHGVNWVLLVYIIFALLSLWFCSRFLDFSVRNLIAGVAAEVRQFAGLEFTAGALNILGALFVSLLVIMYTFLDPIKKLQEMGSLLHLKKSESSDFELVYVITVILLYIIISIICSSIIDRRGNR